jgi:poly(beta-D-mannuronate) lyase
MRPVAGKFAKNVTALAGAAVGILIAINASAASGFTCPEFPEPSVSLEYGSRYKADSKTRSEKDVESDKQVTAALKPSDDFVRQLTEISNAALSDPKVTDEATRCVVMAISRWAMADAFSDIRTLTAEISYPARVGGIAVAYRQVLPFAEEYAEERATIEDWMRSRADAIIAFWNEDAPPLVKQANLRAWAALAITQIGLILDEDPYLEWALLSQRIILDTEDEDGSLPLEMRRGKWALHYQLHAMAPMAVTSALLCQSGYRNPEPYEQLLEKAVAFSLDAVEDPGIAEQITGKAQTVVAGLDNQKPHAIAWLEAYLNFSFDTDLDKRLAPFRPMTNSKLGGDLTMQFRNNDERPKGCRWREDAQPGKSQENASKAKSKSLQDG